MAGAGYKLFNTGDVLTAAQVNTYLMQQTVMVFASSAARTSALSGVLAEGMVSYLQDSNTLEVYDGSAWVGATGDITGLTAGTGITITNATGPVPTVTSDVATTFDAKGDLVVGTGADTFSKLTVGGNGETIVADSSTSTGLRYQPKAATNYALNSDFSIWQRGTSVTPTANGGAYTADRWFATRGSNTSITVSQQTAGNLSVTPNQAFRYCARVLRTASSTTTTDVRFGQMFETQASVNLAGQTVTFSGWIRKGANYSATSDALVMTIIEGTGTDQKQMDGGYTGSNNVVAGTKTLTSSWQRFSVTGTVATTSTEITIQFSYTPTGTAGAADYFEVTGVQLELGSVPTAWNLAANTLAGELAACQRYYYRAKAGTSTYPLFTQWGTATSATTLYSALVMPVEMRTNATSVDYSTLRVVGQSTGVYNAITNVTIDSVATSLQTTMLVITSTGMTTNAVYGFGGNNSTSSYIGVSAEL